MENMELLKAVQEMMDANQAKVEANQGKMAARLVAKIEDIKVNQAKTEFTQEEMNAKMDMHQENMEATMHSIRSELEETIKHEMEDILSYVNLQTQGFCKELIEKIDKTQVDLQTVKMPLDMWTKSF
jgi:hypothetical protein